MRGERELSRARHPYKLRRFFLVGCVLILLREQEVGVSKPAFPIE